MTMISLVCLLALSSVALARPYGGYGAQPMPQTLIRRPVIQTFPTESYGQIEVQPSQPRLSGYGQIEVQPSQPRLSGYGQSFISEPRTILPPPMPLPLSRADLVCRGKLPETVIVMEDKRGVFVCLDDSKGEEILCQPGLWYHEGLRRCERTLGPIPNACDSQPCLNGGQCFQDGSHYQCQCAPGFDGTICELDARVCQTQQPCGSAAGTRCQSFRPNAALQYICVHQNGLAYGFSAQQVVPSPCTGIDGAVALSITDKGVAYCDGDRLSLESCVEKTHWDDQIKACIWDDETIPGTNPTTFPETFIGSKTIMPPRSSYGSYGEQIPPPPPKMIESYGEQLPPPPPRSNNYGTLPPPPPKMIESYGEQIPPPPRSNNYGTLPPPPPRSNNYGTVPPPPRVNTYGTLPPPPRVNNYGTVQPPPPRVNNYGTVQPPPPRVNNYGTLPPPPPRSNNYGTVQPPPPRRNNYGTLPPPPPRMIESYGEQIPPPPPKLIESYGEQLPPPPKVSPPSGY